MTAVDPSPASPAQKPLATCPIGVPLCPFLQQDGLHLELTASLGLATYQPYSLSSAAELLLQVDSYRFEAIQRGRNRLCHTDVPLAEDINNEEKQAL